MLHEQYTGFHQTDDLIVRSGKQQRENKGGNKVGKHKSSRIYMLAFWQILRLLNNGKQLPASYFLLATVEAANG